MSAPLNIPSTSEKKCSLKCSLLYNYPTSPNIRITRIKNNPSYTTYSYLLIKTDDISSKNPVIYNSIPYTFTEMYIYNGGIHHYGGRPPDLEIVIKHMSGNNSLYICIPVYQTASNTSINLVDNIINSYDSSTPGTVYVQSLNLGYIIPKTTYFTHTGIYRDGDRETDVYLTFPPNSFYLNDATVKKFNKLCTGAYAVKYTYSNLQIYQNEKGTTENGFSGEGQIYIDCQPTDSEGEIIVKAEGPRPLPPINTRTILSVVIAVLFFIFSIYALRGIQTYLRFSGNAIKKGIDAKAAAKAAAPASAPEWPK